MTDTRITYLRLQSPRLNLFCEAFEQKVKEGWVISSPARAGATMYIITLQKDVPINSPVPVKALWNCKPEHGIEVLESSEIEVDLVKEQPDEPYPPVNPIDLLPTGQLSGFHKGVADIIGSIITDRPNENINIEITVKETGNVEPVIIEGTISEEIKPEEELKEDVAKSENGFILKAYTLEEVQKLSWQELTKLNADLGLEKGKKPVMEQNIVEASLSKWGNK